MRTSEGQDSTREDTIACQCNEYFGLCVMLVLVNVWLLMLFINTCVLFLCVFNGLLIEKN